MAASSGLPPRGSRGTVSGSRVATSIRSASSHALAAAPSVALASGAEAQASSPKRAAVAGGVGRKATSASPNPRSRLTASSSRASLAARGNRRPAAIANSTTSSVDGAGYPDVGGGTKATSSSLVVTTPTADSDDGDSLPVAKLGVDGFSATDRHVALGGQFGAHRQFADGCRWVGGQTAVVDHALVKQCAENIEEGKIVDLNFHFKFLQEIGGLESHAAHLRSLDLSSNNIRNIAGLKGMSKLRELKLYGCQISRIQNLEPCYNLCALHLEDNQVGAIEGLDVLRALERLNLDSNRIQRIGRGLVRLTRLKELHLARNRLTALEGLTSLVALEQLDVSHNQIREITSEAFKGLVKLDELVLAGNFIESVAFLSSGAQGTLPNLSTLDVSGNRLVAKGLNRGPVLTQLVEVNLADNCLEALPDSCLTRWPSLEILDLSGNKLSQLEDLERLRALPLKELGLQGNPIARESDDLKKALAGLESLEYIDEKPVEALPRLQDVADNDLVALEDIETFHLTDARGVSRDSTTTPGAASSRPSRPGTAGSRPGTAGSRPGTAQSLKEAGVKDPLMHARLKLSDRRYATEEQATLWEQQTLSSLAAIEKQVDKTVQQAQAGLRTMGAYLEKAEQVLRKERDLQAKGMTSPTARARDPSLEVDEDDRPEAASNNPPASSRARRLREAVRFAVPATDAEAKSDVSEDESPKPGEAALSPRAVVCDEEIEEEEEPRQGSHVEEVVPPEVDEEPEQDDNDGEAAASPPSLSRGSSRGDGFGALSPGEPRVSVRAGVRRAAAGGRPPAAMPPRSR